MDDIFEGFLKIQLKKATQLPRSWVRHPLQECLGLNVVVVVVVGIEE